MPAVFAAQQRSLRGGGGVAGYGFECSFPSGCADPLHPTQEEIRACLLRGTGEVPWEPARARGSVAVVGRVAWRFA
jgi:hypothetical protein